jgi:S1-C subfamily serine protease
MSLSAPPQAPAMQPAPAAVPSAPPELSEAVVANLVAPSVVQLVNDDGSSGSGVQIAEGILTNGHVIKGHPQTRVLASDGTSSIGTVTRLDDVRDLAIVSTELQLKAIDREPAAMQRQGETVLVFGHPLGIGGEATLTRGLLSATRLDRSGVTLVQTDAATNPGNSGGPLVNLRGKLVGVIFGGFADTQGLNFAVATESINDFLNGAPLPPTSSGSTTRVATSPTQSGSWRVWLSDLTSATGMGLDQSGNVYVASGSSGGQGVIAKYSPDAQLLASWPTRGNGLAVDQQGNTYQASAWDFGVKKFNLAGKLLATWGTGKAGTALGQFNDPLGVAVDSSNGVVYVADAGNDRVQKLTTDGRPLGALPLGERVFTVTADPTGTLWESTGSTLIHISADLRILDRAKLQSGGLGSVMGFDPLGNLYVAEPPEIHKVSAGGQIQSWGSSGKAPGQFSSWIEAIGVDAQGRIYVLDAGNNRIQQYTP